MFASLRDCLSSRVAFRRAHEGTRLGQSNLAGSAKVVPGATKAIPFVLAIMPRLVLDRQTLAVPLFPRQRIGSAVKYSGFGGCRDVDH